MMNFLAQLAQVADENKALYANGSLGVVVILLLRDIAKKVSSLSHSQNGMTRALLISEMNRSCGNPTAKHEAEKMLTEITQKDSR